MQLRGYQTAALDAIFAYWATEGGSPLVEMATGTGKSLVIAELCRRLWREYPRFKILVVTHVKELIEQNHAELRAIWPLAPAGINSASIKGDRSTNERIIFCGIQTVHRKAAMFGAVDLLLIDEAHLVPRNAATMYGRFIADLQALNPEMRVAGLTATPYRLGSGRLDVGDGAMFDKIVFSYGIADGVRDGYLARLVSKATVTGFDLTGVGKSGGEYIEKQLQAAVDKTEITRRAVDEAAAFGRDRKSWLAFCSGVEHAYHVRDEIRLRGVVAETVTGKTPPEERSRILKDFKTGHIRCVTNNSVLTTGFNAPGVDMIMAMRPTASPSLYVQMMGRGTRKAPGKENCLVLDFAKLIYTHGPVDNVKPPKEKGAGGVAPVKECPNCHSLIHASLRECPDCGYGFPPSDVISLTARASALAIMGSAPAEWLSVAGRGFSMYYSNPGAPTCVQTVFKCGPVQHDPPPSRMARHKTYLCPEHKPGKAKTRADNFWKDHGGRLPVPSSAVSWVSRSGELRETASIQVEPNGKRMEVVNYRAAAVDAPSMMVAGVGMSSKADRGLEFYRTPIEATRALIAIEGDRLPQNIWEPACGDGAMAEPLGAAGRTVLATDIVDRGYDIGDVDFLTTRLEDSAYINAVVTNPPFSLAQQFVDRSFSFSNIHYCALLLRLAFLESGKRKEWFEANPTARVHVSSRRLPMMHRENYEGVRTASSAIPHAWFVWLRGYDGPPQLRWFDWREFSPASDATIGGE